MIFLEAPQNLNGPTGTCHEPNNRKYLKRQANGYGFDVVHEDVAHANPDVPKQAQDDRKGQCFHGL